MSKDKELDVLVGKAARTNLAIFEILAKESPQTLKQLQKRITKYPRLQETYYASLTKRLHNLMKTGYIKQAQPKQEGTKAQTYELRTKAYLAMLLNEYSIQDILDQATDTQAAYMLLSLLNVLTPKDD
jgi:hypothetical protein